MLGKLVLVKNVTPPRFSMLEHSTGIWYYVPNNYIGIVTDFAYGGETNDWFEIDLLIKGKILYFSGRFFVNYFKVI